MPTKQRFHGHGHDPATADLLDVLADAEAPVFATDDEQRVTFWNRGAEQLFGRDPADAIGRTCWEVTRGRDPFGNRYCYRECPVTATRRRGEAVSGCEFMIPLAGEDERLQPVAVTLLPIGNGRRDAGDLLHILCPLGAAPRHRVEAAESPREAQGHVRTEAHAGGNGHGGGNGNGKAGTGRGTLVVLPGSLGRRGDQPASVTTAPGAPATASCDPPLTAREAEILRWVATGLQNKEVAQKLGISLATVRNHIHSILDKLDVHSKLEAVSLAFRNGWVSGEAGDGSGAPPASARPWTGTA